MVDPIALKLLPRAGLSQKQTQRLIMSQHMQQALHLLQLPIQEVAQMIEQEIEQNPVLDYVLDQSEGDREDQDEEQTLEKPLEFSDRNYDRLHSLDRDFKDHFEQNSSPRQTAEEARHQSYRESLIVDEESLFEHLMNQAAQTFERPSDLLAAEALIGNFDESGFLTTPLSEIALLSHVEEKELLRVLKEIQQFEPHGVGALSLRESLLIQLRHLGKEKTLAYRVIDEEYDDLLHNKIPDIKRKLKCSQDELNEAIYEQIAKLDFHPGSSFSQNLATPIVPDVSIVQRGEELIVVSHDEEYLPHVRLNEEYVKLIEGQVLSHETSDFIKQKVHSAKWLLRNIHQRGLTLKRIAYSLLQRQKDFFDSPTGQLVPLTMLALSEELELHESTIARAVSNKYMNTPRGLFALRFFFSNALGSDKGEISSRTVRDYIIDLIDSENKRAPLSDEVISKKLRDKGIECSRRTVAKYRSQLKIGNAHQRKKY